MRKFCAWQVLSSIALVMTVAGTTNALAQGDGGPDGGPGGGPGGGAPDPARMIQRMDANGDGKISKDEWRGPEAAFTQLDTNKDGFITAAELQAGMSSGQMMGGPGMRGNMQEMQLNMIKDRLKPTDEEWAVLKDLVTKTIAARQASEQYVAGGRGMGGPGGMMGGRGRRNRNAGAQATTTGETGGPGGPGPDGMGGPGMMGGPGGGPDGMGGPGGMGGGMGRGGRGGMGGRFGGPPQAIELRALNTTLSNESSTVDQVKAALTTFREARAKADASLKDARTNLQKVVTVKQEAVLVAAGLLE